MAPDPSGDGWIRPGDRDIVPEEGVASVALLAVGAALTSMAAGLTLAILLAASRHLHGSAGVPWGEGWWFALVSFPVVLVESFIGRRRHRLRAAAVAAPE